MRARLTLGWAADYPIRRVLLAGNPFEHVADSTLIFYDWLRNERRDILGVRCYPQGNSFFLIDMAANLEYAKTRVSPEQSEYALNQNELEIYFGKDRLTKSEFSCDQDFLYEELFRSENGEAILAFATEGFLDTDYRALESSGADWAHFEVE